MNCPNCGAWARVLETRAKTGNTTRRRYECANEHRFSSIEQICEGVEPKRILKQADKKTT